MLDGFQLHTSQATTKTDALKSTLLGFLLLTQNYMHGIQFAAVAVAKQNCIIMKSTQNKGRKKKDKTS